MGREDAAFQVFGRPRRFLSAFTGFRAHVEYVASLSNYLAQRKTFLANSP